MISNLFQLFNFLIRLKFKITDAKIRRGIYIYEFKKDGKTFKCDIKDRNGKLIESIPAIAQ